MTTSHVVPITIHIVLHSVSHHTIISPWPPRKPQLCRNIHTTRTKDRLQRGPLLLRHGSILFFEDFLSCSELYITQQQHITIIIIVLLFGNPNIHPQFHVLPRKRGWT